MRRRSLKPPTPTPPHNANSAALRLGNGSPDALARPDTNQRTLEKFSRRGKATAYVEGVFRASDFASIVRFVEVEFVQRDCLRSAGTEANAQ